LHLLYTKKRLLHPHHHNAQDYQGNFLGLCVDFVRQVNFPNIDVSIEDFKTGKGWFSTKETTPMVFVRLQNSKFNNLDIFFRAQQFGNIIHYSVFETIDIDFKGKTQNENSNKNQEKV
jgi:hypothetical protein